MLYAKVVLGLPVDLAFDYSVPKAFQKNIAVGARVLVNFRNKKSTGYVIGLAHKTGIKNIKDVLGLIDEKPLLGKDMLLLARKIADYYCCSYGEAIKAMVPQEVRKGKNLGDAPQGTRLHQRSVPLGSVPQVLHVLEPKRRWEIYIAEAKKAQESGESAIILFSDIQRVLKAKEIFKDARIENIRLLYRKEKEEFTIWQEIRSKAGCIVLGTRSAVFAPVNNLGLIILDHEEDSSYKQEQVPHYHARQVAFMRAKIEGAKIILESISPDLESFYLAQERKIDYRVVKREKDYPKVMIIDTRRTPYAQRKNRAIFSRDLTDAILAVLKLKGKVLVFINRRGFATYVVCNNCGKVLKCPRCNINLVYHYDQDILRCHHCVFKMAPPQICPDCHAGYIKYSGIGTDKVESELARIFPQARVGEEIIVSTSLILKEEGQNFDLICVLNIDHAINRVDYMAADKVFYLLSGLITLTDREIIIPTSFPGHHCFESLLKADPRIFYLQELKFRRQLKYPPFRHIAQVKLRGRIEVNVKKAAERLFEKLKEGSKDVRALSISPGEPPKLRGNFYWQILFSALSPQKLSKFLKIHLKNDRYSGIIVTVDIDPL
ncbi:MAG: primosomal protein N' [Candidatus Omnitrophica bacterium]|nr:primosomal protein N' [Candidatus Omnitrophota bacterium]